MKHNRLEVKSAVLDDYEERRAVVVGLVGESGLAAVECIRGNTVVDSYLAPTEALGVRFTSRGIEPSKSISVDEDN